LLNKDIQFSTSNISFLKYLWHGSFTAAMFAENHADLNPELPPPASTEHSHESADMALLFALLINYLDRKLRGMVASWLARCSPNRAVWVQALARNTVVFSGKPLNSHSASLHPGV